MASIIRIKRSSVSGNPATLAAGELAYSALADNGSNGGDRLYIGMGTETAGNAANRIVIGGKYYTGLVDAGGSGGTLNTSAKSIPVLSATGTIDTWKVGNLQLTVNTLSSTSTNGDINITPNGTGKTIIANPYIGDSTTTLAEFIYDTVGGAVTGGTGITITNSDAGNTSTVNLANTSVTAGSYGSATQIPTFTVDAQGRLTAAGTAAISTTLNIAADTGTDAITLGTDTITFAGGTGIDSVINSAANTVTFNIDSTVATLTGTQTLTNKTIDLTNNTLTATSDQLRTAVSDETGSGSLVFATSPTLVTPILGAATATSITATSGNLTIAAAAGNNSVNLTPTGTGTVDVGNKRITSVAEPTQSTDAATKNYVDAVKTGLDPKDSVRIATTGALTATYSNGSSGVGATLTNSGTQAAFTVDSIVAIVGDRVLVKDQASALQNGIYTVTTVGTASTNWVLTRAIDADQQPEVTPGAFTFVEEGTVNSNNGFVCTTTGTITIGTTSINWVQFSGAGQVIAGAGLTKSGNTLDVVGTANRITVASDSVDIASTYVGQTSITTLGTIGIGTWQGTIVGPTYGGTGVNNGSNTLTLAGNVSHAGAFTQTFTATGNTSVTLPTTGTLATLAGSEALTNKTVNGLTITSTTGTLTVVSGGTLATAGAFSTTLTSTATTNVTLPTTGTLATLAGTESLSNKTITASSFAGSVAATTLSASGLVTLTNTTDASAIGTAAVVMSGGLSVAKAIYVGTNITGAGPATSTLDGFNLDGGTY